MSEFKIATFNVKNLIGPDQEYYRFQSYTPEEYAWKLTWLAEARALAPIHERQALGRSILLFDGVERRRLAALGDVRTPSIADLFVAVLGKPSGPEDGVAP